MPERKSKQVAEFGDFQTPDSLAVDVCKVLQKAGIDPSHILEPTCGRGSFLEAAAEIFPSAHLVGVDINPDHLSAARKRLQREFKSGRIELLEGDFFKFNWGKVFDRSSSEWFILGNPPWVTSAELGALSSDNLPEKSNFQGRSGIAAITGKSNFDISEWMVLRYLDWLRGQSGGIAVLVKTAVARKILAHTWKVDYPVKTAAIYSIDAKKHFVAAVDACLFVLVTEPSALAVGCSVYERLQDANPSHTIGVHDGLMVSDVEAYTRWRHLTGEESRYVWRSGIKHDCSKVMELTADNGQYRNGFNEVVTIEPALLYPLFKSSDVSKSNTNGRRFMLVTQTHPGEDTARLRTDAPQAWEYLQRHADLLGNRGSVIYRHRPPFSIFGVGEYTFTPWKVAISGFYKSLRFAAFGPIDERPPVFDDTVYFLSCRSQQEAEFLAYLLNSIPAQEFYSSMIFWADKRPITIEILKRLSISVLASELGLSEQYESFSVEQARSDSRESQLPLLEL